MHRDGTRDIQTADSELHRPAATGQAREESRDPRAQSTPTACWGKAPPHSGGSRRAATALTPPCVRNVRRCVRGSGAGKLVYARGGGGLRGPLSPIPPLFRARVTGALNGPRRGSRGPLLNPHVAVKQRSFGCWISYNRSVCFPQLIFALCVCGPKGSPTTALIVSSHTLRGRHFFPGPALRSDF